LVVDRSVVVAARLDTGALRADPPALFRNLVRRSPAAARQAQAAAPSVAAGAAAPALADLAPEARDRAVLDLVRNLLAEVLGHRSASAIPLDRGLLDLGLDSLGAVDLRNRLNAATGLRLPATALFDHPTGTALAAHISAELAPAATAGASPVPAPARSLLELVAELEAATSGAADRPAGDGTPDGLDEAVERLQDALARLRTAQGDTGVQQLDEVSDDELFDFIDGQLGA
ncbi:phosphopantetheine-binding protein, partial [Kitasatospora sp. NPDC057223]|uniref:phosphopantetheine-binding protein n=1 Tax=Kitasatospora sp. NPDC057223 TaxID=3346055 RepID=UPI003625753D